WGPCISATNPSATRRRRLRYTVPRLTRGNRRRTTRWTHSAVGCGSVPRSTSRTTRRGPVRRRPRARRAASEFLGMVLIYEKESTRAPPMVSRASSLSRVSSRRGLLPRAPWEMRSTGTTRASVAPPLPPRVNFPSQEDLSNASAPVAPDRGSPAEQSEERVARHPARPGHRGDGRLGIRQVFPCLRHHLRRGAVALYRIALRLRPHVPRAAGSPRRGPHRAHPARHRPRAEEPGAHRAFHRGHGHRASRLPPPALRQGRPGPLPHLWQRGTQ